MILKHQDQLVRRHHHTGIVFQLPVSLVLLSILTLNTQTAEAQSANINVNNPQIWTNAEQNLNPVFISTSEANIGSTY